MSKIYHIPDSTEPHPTWDSAQVTERAQAIRANNRDFFTVDGTNTWILHEPDSDKVLIVDPGPKDDAHFDAILEAVERLDATIAGIALTHKHLDHCSGVPHLIERIGDIPVYGRAPLEDLMITDLVNFSYHPLPDGPFSPAPGLPEMNIISLPGHSSDSIGIVLPAEASVVTGDIIFRDWSTTIVHPDGKLSDYFDSLHLLERMVEDSTAQILLTGHGNPIDDPESAVASYFVHRKHRLDDTRRVIRDIQTAEPKAVCERLYRHINQAGQLGAYMSTMAQLAYLHEIGDPCLEGLPPVSL